MVEFKGGVAHVAKRYPQVPIVPVFSHGLGKSLPKGEALLVPFFCDVYVGPSLFRDGESAELMERLVGTMNSLAAQGTRPPWE